MKKLLILATIIIIGISGFLSGCISEGTGTLILQITDDPGDLNITEALITLSQIKVHFTGFNDSNISAGWITVINETQTFNLIALQDVTDLLGEANLSAGWYTQIRLNVDQALITIDGVQYDMKIPSKTIKLIKPWKIENDETLILTLDFDVQKSVHQTGNDKYIFKPTIKIIQE